MDMDAIYNINFIIASLKQLLHYFTTEREKGDTPHPASGIWGVQVKRFITLNLFYHYTKGHSWAELHSKIVQNLCCPSVPDSVD